MSRLRAPKRNYLQAQSIAQLKLCSNPPSPSPPSPSPPSPTPHTPHPSLPHPLPLTLLAWLKMTVSLRFKKGSVTKFCWFLSFKVQWLSYFNVCLCLYTYLVANLTIFCLAFHTVSIILSRGLLVNCCVKYTITTTNLFCLSFLSFTGHRDHS